MPLNERQQELISGLVDSALQGDELREAQELVAAQPEAARLLEDYRSDLQRLKNLPRMKADPALRARIQPPRPAAPSWLKAAAIVLIVGGFAFWVYKNRPIKKLIALAPAFEARLDPGEHRLVKVFSGLKGKLVAEAVTHFKMMIDGDGQHPAQCHLVLNYDFDGDGKFDRKEIYEVLADATPGLQQVTDDAAKLISVEGAPLRDMADGVLQAEIQNVHPQNAMLADIQEITLPNLSP